MFCRTSRVAFYGAVVSLGWITCAWAEMQIVPTISVVPRPMRMELHQGSFVLSPQTAIIADAELQAVGRCLAEQLQPATGYTLSVENAGANPRRPNAIVLRMEAGLADQLGKEGYRLTVTSKEATILASSAAGAFYGCQTIRQLLPPEAVGEKRAEGVAWTLPCLEIDDRPRFAWRGLMLDCSRTFQSIDYLKKTIRVMALYKLNVLHLHLTDDQGWRLEIKKYPRLTELGAKFAAKYAEPLENEGFYTQEHMRSLIKYAAERQITIVPEIEMPGHSYAAMVCYPELSCTGGPFAGIFPYGKGEEITRDICCTGNERTFSFLEDVLSEVIELFPSKYIHVGGDETPKTRWNKCPKCQKRIREEGLKNSDELQSYFIKRIERYLNSKGRTLIGWDEILEGGLAPRAVAMSWRGVAGGIAAAKAGHNVVMTPDTHCYLDHNYAATSTKKVYSYEPIPAVLSAEEGMRILGVQGCFWSHIDRTPDRVDRQLYPRLLALAEKAWSPPDACQFSDFSDRMPTNLQRLTLLNCQSMPPAGKEKK